MNMFEQVSGDGHQMSLTEIPKLGDPMSGGGGGLGQGGGGLGVSMFHII